jgi:hypothetical protein
MLCAMAEPTENEQSHEEPEASEPTGNEQSHEEPEASEPPRRVRKKRWARSPGSVVRWLASAALVAALGALGISSWVLLRPPSTSAAPATTSGSAASSAPSAQQIADAKTRACGAYNTVGTAVTLRSNADPGPDPAGVQAQATAANTRLALIVGHSYLLSRLDPATPAPLAAALRRFAGDLQEVAIYALAGVNTDDPAQAGRLQDVVALNTQITEMCK